MYDTGISVALGFNDPKKLKTLLKKKAKDTPEASGMLAIPKKR